MKKLSPWLQSGCHTGRLAGGRFPSFCWFWMSLEVDGSLEVEKIKVLSRWRWSGWRRRVPSWSAACRLLVPAGRGLLPSSCPAQPLHHNPNPALLLSLSSCKTIQSGTKHTFATNLKELSSLPQNPARKFLVATQILCSLTLSLSGEAPRSFPFPYRSLSRSINPPG